MNPPSVCVLRVLVVMVMVCCAAQLLMENQDFLISVREWSDSDEVWFNPSGTYAVCVDQSPATDGDNWILRIAKNNQNRTLMVDKFSKYCFS